MTEPKKPKATLTLGKAPESKRTGGRPATSRKVNLERDRTHKPRQESKPAEHEQEQDRAKPQRRHRKDDDERSVAGTGRRPYVPVAEQPAAARSTPQAAAPRAPRQPAVKTAREPARQQPVRIEQFFATCPRGLEPLLVQELTRLGADEIESTHGGVGFHGPMTLCYAVNLHSRVATRVLLRVSAGKYSDEESVYQGALAVYWDRWFEVSRSIAVKVVAQDSPLKSLNFITLKIKDAVCDRFREASGMRPSVQTLHPDIRIHAFLTRDRYTLYLDTSGESLYKRGLRKQSGLAPINENLAAGILMLSGWKPGEALYDPMCGSGTFLLEAVQMALNIAPGLGRDFAFERMLRMDLKAWKQMKAEAQAACLPVQPLAIYGSDVLGASLRDADANLKAAGLRDAVNLNKSDILDIEPPAESGVIVMNPPYGVRLGDDEQLAALYPGLGDILKRRFSGWRAYIISADANLPKLIRLSASKKTPLFNGALECRLYEYKLVEGSNR